MWLYQNKEIKELSDMPGDNFGFIYEVTHLPTGRKYLGKKQLISVTKKALGKKELALITDKRASKSKIVRKESDWKTYYGSHSEIKQLNKRRKTVGILKRNSYLYTK
jgi:protein-arginine kinase